MRRINDDDDLSPVWEKRLGSGLRTERFNGSGLGKGPDFDIPGSSVPVLTANRSVYVMMNSTSYCT